MTQTSSKMRGFAEHLIAYETKGHKSSGPTALMACLVGQRLGPHLATLMGTAGFHALLSRALALANADVPWLRAVHVNADGSYEGLDESGAQVDPADVAEGCAVLLARLLGLLVTFIGEELTLWVVREAWPKLSLNAVDFGAGNKK